MRDDGPEPLLTVAEAAERLGVTPRALRLYERKGLVTPRRTSAGWRVYGRPEIERLHGVLALKSLGLPLERIKQVLTSGAVDLDRVLAAQEEALAAEADRAVRALLVVWAARVGVNVLPSLSTDELVTLTKETAVADYRPGPEMDQLIQKHFTPSIKERFKAAHADRLWTQADYEASLARWKRLVARAEALLGSDPGSHAALELARDWAEEAAKFHQGEQSVIDAMVGLYEEAFTRDDSARGMPFSREVWGFVKAARDKLIEQHDGVI